MRKKPEWKPEYSVNNKLIDLQHQYLFSLCDTLQKLQGASESKQSIEEALTGLLDYIDLHFREEEELYKAHPEFEAHHQIHQELSQQTNRYVENFHDGKLGIDELLDFIYTWIIEHITITDSKYFKDIEEMNL